MEQKDQIEVNGNSDSCSRRDFMKKAGGVMVASSLAGMGIIDPAALLAAVRTKRKVRVGIFGPSHCAAPFVYAKLKGFLTKEQIDLELINYPEMPLIAKDIISGKLDFGQLIVPLAFAVSSGAKPFNTPTPLVITQIGGTNGAALMVRNGLDIKRAEDFKGKSLANHSKLSVHYLINMMFLEKHGLNPAKDVRFKVVELDDVVGQMKSGELDSFVMPEPKNAVVELNGIGSAFMMSKYIWPNHPCCALVTRSEYFSKNRELATAVTRGFTRGGLLANEADNREELVDMLRRSNEFKYDKLPKEVLMRAFTPGRSDFYPFPYQSSARVIIEIMKRHGLLPAHVIEQNLAQEVFLSDLSRKVMKDLGATPPAQNFRTEKILGELKNYGV